MSPPRRSPVSLSARGQRLLLSLGVLAFFAFIAGVASGAGGGPTVGYIHTLGSFGPSLGQRERAALAHVLTYTSFLAKGTPNKREVALTFDDGPGPYTGEVLRVLQRTRTPATFFAVGSQYRYFYTAGQAEFVDGYPIENHTEDHIAMGTISAAAQNQQLDESAASMAHFGLPKPTLFRPPYGSYSPTTLAVLKQQHMLMVVWSIDSEDWTVPGVDTIVHNVLDHIGPGDVVLMHDAGGDRSETVAALPTIIAGLKARHLKPVTVPQLILDDPPPRGQGAPAFVGGG